MEWRNLSTFVRNVWKKQIAPISGGLEVLCVYFTNFVKLCTLFDSDTVWLCMNLRLVRFHLSRQIDGES